jgi:hypothetical protein
MSGYDYATAGSTLVSNVPTDAELSIRSEKRRKRKKKKKEVKPTHTLTHAPPARDSYTQLGDDVDAALARYRGRHSNSVCVCVCVCVCWNAQLFLHLRWILM